MVADIRNWRTSVEPCRRDLHSQLPGKSIAKLRVGFTNGSVKIRSLGWGDFETFNDVHENAGEASNFVAIELNHEPVEEKIACGCDIDIGALIVHDGFDRYGMTAETDIALFLRGSADEAGGYPCQVGIIPLRKSKQKPHGYGNE
ncbi:MAG: hypothetical protein EOM26_13015 [Alphaproteobacteria bacterium]|nr:hypothetical protein [Alphaproteobacteria bacterium]